MAEECGRPGTWRSNVGCEAIEEPWTKRIVPAFRVPCAAGLFHRKRFTSPLRVQCSVPPVQVLVDRSFMARSVNVHRVYQANMARFMHRGFRRLSMVRKNPV